MAILVAPGQQRRAGLDVGYCRGFDAAARTMAVLLTMRLTMKPNLAAAVSFALPLALAAQIAVAGPRVCESDGQYACAGEDAARADRALNLAYKDAMARLDANGKASLRAAQRAWIRHRDKECGALMGQGRVLACEQDLTITRTGEIQRL